MLRYLPGLLLVQIVTVALVWAAAGSAPLDLLMRAGVPALVVCGVTALWFSQIGRSAAEGVLARTRFEHLEERERLRREAMVESERLKLDAHARTERVKLDAEREKARVIDDARERLRREERRVDRRANLKVGAAFAAATGLGVLMLMTQLVSLGIVTITTAGGAMGGYLLHWKQTRRRLDAVVKSVAEDRAGLAAGGADVRGPDAAGMAGDGPDDGPGGVPAIVDASARTKTMPRSGIAGGTPSRGRGSGRGRDRGRDGR